MKLSEIKHILDAEQIRLSKSLGQNFLHDGNQLRRIVSAAALTRQDRVLEIGPGLGPLTELLLAKAGQVMAIEKDRRLADYLHRRWSEAEGLVIVHADALEYLGSSTNDWSSWKLVANLPYAVASPILVELAQTDSCPNHVVVTLQLEVARRLVAKPEMADYGLLSLLIQLRYEPVDCFKIPAGCFYPPPNVDSACVTLVRRPLPLLAPDQAEVFVKIVKRSFSQRRKMMRKLLKEDWPVAHVASAFEQLRISPQVRAECVSLQQFVRLTQLLHASVSRRSQDYANHR